MLTKGRYEKIHTYGFSFLLRTAGGSREWPRTRQLYGWDVNQSSLETEPLGKSIGLGYSRQPPAAIRWNYRIEKRLPLPNLGNRFRSEDEDDSKRLVRAKPAF
jgi:hypothetical protein